MELVIFDCDGVLVDSEPLSCRILAEEFTKFGYPISTEDAVRTFKGTHLHTTIARIEHAVGRTVPEDFIDVYRRRSFELFRQELTAITGVSQALDRIGRKKCVASNGPKHKMELNLELAGIMHHFEDALFSAYDINKWKPEPDLFLHAADHMGVRPAHAVVVEDSIHGVEAAVNPGMMVLAYCSEPDAKDMKQAGARPFAHMDELPDLLDRL